MSDLVIDDETLADLAAVAQAFATPDVSRVRALTENGASFDRQVWTRFAELGWLGLAIPESFGGAGADERAVTVVAEKLGAGAYPEPYVASGVFVAALLGDIAGQGCAHARRVLDSAITGKELLSVATDADGGPLAPEPISAAPSDAGITLDGVVHWVAVADADAFLVTAATSGGRNVVARVRRDASGLEIVTHRMSDATTTASLTFRNVVVDHRDTLGVGTDVGLALTRARDCALVAVAAELVGVADRALDITLEFIKVREQFGKPIGSFQVLMHRAVDMYIQLRLARAVLRSALKVRADPDSSRDARAAAASSAKARSNIAATLICRQAVQLHGAIGFTDEYDLGYYVNRMVTLTAWLGGADVHRRRYLELVEGDDPLDDEEND